MVAYPQGALESGHKVLWYRIDRVLGYGSFGITYLAEDLNLKKTVAIKEFRPDTSGARKTDPADSATVPLDDDTGPEQTLKFFLNEARALAQLEHPNIVGVLNVFEENGTAYMVMNYESGISLDYLLKQQQSLDEYELLRITGPLLDGIEKMHANGFIHRDIKPSNIHIRRDGTPVLLDFGSVRQSVPEQAKDSSRLVSPGYAPIEQYTGESVLQGPWSDIYGMGATMYRAVTGRVPPPATDRRHALKQGRDPLAPAARLVAGSYDRRLLAAIDHALALRPEDRPQDVASWRHELGYEHADFPAQKAAPAAGEVTATPVGGGADQEPEGERHRSLPTCDPAAPDAPGAEASSGADGDAPAADRNERRRRGSIEASIPKKYMDFIESPEAVFRFADSRAAPVDPSARKAYDEDSPSADTTGRGDNPEKARDHDVSDRLPRDWDYDADLQLPELNVQSEADAVRSEADTPRSEARAPAAEPVALTEAMTEPAVPPEAGTEPTLEPVRENRRVEVFRRYLKRASIPVVMAALLAIAVAGLLIEDPPPVEAPPAPEPALPSADEPATGTTNSRVGPATDSPPPDPEQPSAERAADTGTPAQPPIIETETASTPAPLAVDETQAPESAASREEPAGEAADTRPAGEPGAEQQGEAAESAATAEAGAEADTRPPAADPEAAETETAASQPPDEAAETPDAAGSQPQQADIEALLAAARVDFEARRLTTPDGNNALEKYRAVLEADPDNEIAREGLQEILDLYLFIADGAMARGNFRHAEEMLRRAAKVDPQSPRLEQAYERLRRERDQARLESRPAPPAGTRNRPLSPPLH